MAINFRPREPINRRQQRRKARGNQLAVIMVTILMFFCLVQFFDTIEEEKHDKISQSFNEVGGATQHDPAKTFSKDKLVVAESITEALEPLVGNDGVMQLLRTAGVTELSAKDREALPKWQHISELYGDSIVVQRKETCRAYREAVPLDKRMLAIAGLFNTGTNLLEDHLRKNIHGVKSIWQVPWGKHRMASVKWTHTVKGNEKLDKASILPIVILRDPYAWLQSMCHNPYAARWRHSSAHCPNMVPDEEDRKQFHHLKDSFEVTIQFDATQQRHFESLAHTYSTWYNEYLHADYPMLLVRFEDLVFQPAALLKEIADCVEGSVQDPIRFQLKSSKLHGGGTTYVKAVIKTGDASHRLFNMTTLDLAYAEEHLDHDLMELFHYHQ